MNLDNLGEVIAGRELSFTDNRGSSKSVRVLIGKPTPLPNRQGYYCPFQISGVGTEQVKYAAGVDAVQSLQLVMVMIGVTLQFIVKESDGQIEWEGSPREVGFPTTA